MEHPVQICDVNRRSHQKRMFLDRVVLFLMSFLIMTSYNFLIQKVIGFPIVISHLFFWSRICGAIFSPRAWGQFGVHFLDAKTVPWTSKFWFQKNRKKHCPGKKWCRFLAPPLLKFLIKNPPRDHFSVHQAAQLFFSKAFP